MTGGEEREGGERLAREDVPRGLRYLDALDCGTRPAGGPGAAARPGAAAARARANPRAGTPDALDLHAHSLDPDPMRRLLCHDKAMTRPRTLRRRAQMLEPDAADAVAAADAALAHARVGTTAGCRMLLLHRKDLRVSAMVCHVLDSRALTRTHTGME